MSEILTDEQLYDLRDDIGAGISMIVEKNHYCQLGALAKSQPALLTACEALMELADDGSASFDDPEPGGVYDRARAAIKAGKGK